MKKPQKTESLAYKTIGLETIILDTKLGKEVHQLNEVASFVWDLCDGNHELPAIIVEVCKEFEVDYADAAKDIEVIINEMEAKFLLVEKS